jgi:AraC-like DNA-binding protein
MLDAREALTDVTIHGPRTKLRGVKAAGVDYRPWIAPFPVCPALNRYQIAHVGLMEAVAPYQIARTEQSSTYFLACSGGRGRVLVDGRWRGCRAGMACLMPAHILNAFRAVPGMKWEFCWVCYVQTGRQRPVSDSASPVLARYDPVPLRSAIHGLIHECQSHAAASTVLHWVELIQEYVMRFARPVDLDRQLRLLWDRVTLHLDEEWTLPRLAGESGYSKEHLRRLCHLELGRSPMHQVIYLRMRRAAELLTTTRDKVETIAHAVGYHDAFVFSRAFHKWVGWGPTDYRRGGGQTTATRRAGSS